VGFREVSVVEVREVLRGWLQGAGLRTVAERAGVARKTARRYVAAAQEAGLQRDAGFAAVNDELIALVVSAVRPARPNGHGTAWEALEARQEQIFDESYDVSPMLASHAGLSTAESSLDDVAAEIAAAAAALPPA